jgi:hypothetical protein
MTLSNLGSVLAFLDELGEARKAYEEALVACVGCAEFGIGIPLETLDGVLVNSLGLCMQTGEDHFSWPAFCEALALLAELRSGRASDAET